ncbi:Hypothetical predicted protein [Pelobates cultripes]|uniref:Uncharacterized protein n=1 Tax=Pelobates cultripes TaxID=61616 RepID=A0AAD1W3R7_PELCU|nr:Hypothetical predicted protein [Pelobates cultripes]
MDKVKALAETEADEPLSSRRAPPPNSPTSSKTSTLYGNSKLQEIIQNLPSKGDIASMLAKLDASIHEKLSSITNEARQKGLRVGDLEGDRDNIQLRVHTLEQRQDTQDARIVQILRHTEDLDNRGRRIIIFMSGASQSHRGTPKISEMLQTLFNNIRQRPVETPILMDRAHRTLVGTHIAHSLKHLTIGTLGPDWGYGLFKT